MRRRVERRRVGPAERDHAPAEPAAAHAGPEDAGQTEQVLDQVVDDGHGHSVVAGQAAVPLGHDLAEPDEVAPAEQPLGLSHPGAFSDHVTGPPAQHRIGQRAQVAEGAESEGSTE